MDALWLFIRDNRTTWLLLCLTLPFWVFAAVRVWQLVWAVLQSIQKWSSWLPPPNLTPTDEMIPKCVSGAYVPPGDPPMLLDPPVAQQVAPYQPEEQAQRTLTQQFELVNGMTFMGQRRFTREDVRQFGGNVFEVTDDPMGDIVVQLDNHMYSARRTSSTTIAITADTPQSERELLARMNRLQCVLQEMNLAPSSATMTIGPVPPKRHRLFLEEVEDDDVAAEKPAEREVS